MTTTYEPMRLYAVRLTRPVKLGAVPIRPIATVEMTGTILNNLIEEHGADVVDTAEPR